MPQRQLFSSFSDIPALEAEKQQIKNIFAEIKGGIVELSTLGLKLDTSKGMADVVRMQQQIEQLQTKLLLNQNKLAESEARLEKIRNQAADAAEKADLTRTKNLILQNKELDRQIALEEKKNKGAVAAQKFYPGTSTPVINNMTSQQASTYISSVPFETNLEQLKAEAEAAEHAAVTVNELDVAQAQLANDSTAMGQALKEQAIIMSEAGAEAEGIALKYDEYTGSLAQNIKLQYEASAALKANAASQKEIIAAMESDTGATAQQVVKLEQLRTEAALLTNTNKDLTAIIRLQAQAFNNEEGSAARLAAELDLLSRSYLKLNDAEKKSAFGMQMKSELNTLTPAVAKAEGEVGKFGRNVGNYFGDITQAGDKLLTFITRDLFRTAASFVVFSVAFTALQELGTLFIDLVSKGTDFNEVMKQQTEHVKDLQGAVRDLNQNLKTQVDLTATSGDRQLQSLKDQLTALEATGVNYEKTIALRTKIAELDNAQKGTAADQEKQNAAAEQYQTEINGLQKQFNLGQIDRNTLMQKSAEVFGKFYSGQYNNEQTLASSRKYHFGQYNSLLKDQQRLEEQIENAQKNKFSKSSIERLKIRKEGIDAQLETEKQSYENIDAVQKAAGDASTAYQKNLNEIAKFNADERRRYELESTKVEANAQIESNSRVLSNERSTLNERLKAIRSSSVERQRIAAAELQNIQNDPSKSKVDRLLAEKSYSEQIKKITADSAVERFNIIESYRLREAKAVTDINNISLKDDATFQDQLVSNTIDSIQTRTDALQKFADDQKQIARNSFEYQLQQAGFSKAEAEKLVETGQFTIKNKKITNDELIALSKGYESQLLAISKEVERQTTQIIKDEISKRDKLRQESIDNINRIYSTQSLNTFTQYIDDVLALNKANAQKKISNEKYDDERRKLDDKYRQDTLTQTADDIEEQLKLYDGAEGRLAASSLKLFTDRDKLNKLELTKNNEYLIERLTNEIEVDELEVDSDKKRVDAKIALLEKLKKAQGEASDANKGATDKDKDKDKKDAEYELEQTVRVSEELKNLSDAIHDAKIQQYEDQKTALEKRYNAEIEYINKVYANSVDKQARLDEANKKYSASKAALDLKEKEGQIKKARFDKAQAIFSIILNTAAAIVRDLGNPLKIVFDSIIGAAQLATATATPIPTYGKGTKSSAAGLALVGEAGRELGKEPSGKWILWDKPTLTNLAAGTKIYPNQVTEDMISANRSLFYSLKPKQEQSNTNLDAQILYELKEANKKPPMVIKIEHGMEASAYYQQQMKW